MRSWGFVVALLLALISAAVATGMITVYLKRQADETSALNQPVPVVVSSSDLTFGTTLEAGNLEIALYPQSSLPKGAVSSIDSLVGQTTKVFLAENEPVLTSKLSSIGGGLSLLIAPTLRAVSIEVDKVSGVSGFVLPGDRVDVIAVVRQSSSASEVFAKTILQNVEVLAAGQKTEKEGKDPITVQSVTMLVDPLGAEVLALAQKEGKLQLSLRNPNDTELAKETDALTLSNLFGTKKPPEPSRPPTRSVTMVAAPNRVPPPPKPDSMTIIRGTQTKKSSPAMNPLRPETTGTTPP